jgi:hypothetical protein
MGSAFEQSSFVRLSDFRTAVALCVRSQFVDQGGRVMRRCSGREPKIRAITAGLWEARQLLTL